MNNKNRKIMKIKEIVKKLRIEVNHLENKQTRYKTKKNKLYQNNQKRKKEEFQTLRSVHFRGMYMMLFGIHYNLILLFKYYYLLFIN